MSVIDWMVDRMNPVVLRESRQLVRSRFVVGIMMLFLLVMVVASAIYVLNIGNSSRSNFSHGKNLFAIFYYVLGYATILFIPAYTALPFLAQKQSSSMDLLFISTIPPRAIIFGKISSAFWMMVLMFSVSMPFMVLTALLRGIGLFEVFLFLAALAGLVMLATLGFLLLVCLPTSRVFTGLLSVGYILLLILFPSITATLHYSGLTGEVVAIFLTVTALLLPMMGAAATALISPAVSNRARGVRITITIVWIVAGIAAALGPSGSGEAWTSIFVVGAALAMFACASEPSTTSRRVQRAIPKNRLLRVLVFPFFTGPLSGWVWCGLIGLATLGISEIFFSIYLADTPEFFSFLLYGLAYSLMAVFIRRVTFIRRFCAEKYTWGIALFLAVWGTILPLLANFAVNPNGRVKLLWRLGNPFAAFDEDPEIHVIFAACLCGLLTLMNMRWLLRQVMAFRPAKIAIPVVEEG
jgi:ABC-type transport system involved in multi-copper enzyme maturation permease subunit